MFKEKLFEKIAALVNVKTVVTFAVTAVFVMLAVTGGVSSGEAMTIVTMVLGFYFGTQKQKQEIL